MTKFKVRKPPVPAAQQRIAYAVLGVARGASVQAIHAAYLALARRLHPDCPGGAVAAFAELGNAWALVKTPELKAKYDVYLLAHYSECVPCGGTGQIHRMKRGLLTCEDCGGLGVRS